MTTTTVEGDVGNSVSGGENNGVINQFLIQKLRDLVAANALDTGTVRRLRSVHVATEQSTAATAVLVSRNAVALLGEPGSGRSITGISMFAELRVTPQTLVLDPEYVDRKLEVESGIGYLLHLDEMREHLGPRTSEWISDLAARVGPAGSYLVVRTRTVDWNMLGIDERSIATVRIDPADAVSVFTSHLRSLTNETVASRWAAHEEIRARLNGAFPPEAVRLASIVHTVRGTGIPEADQLGEVLEVDANWTTTLDQWFRRDKDGHHRALLIATAALGRGTAASVYEAARRLGEAIGLDRTPGAVLIGPDMIDLVEAIGAQLHDDRVGFARPAYAEAVLDYVWQRRPQMHPALRNWLAELPGIGEDEGGAARALIELGIRQHDAPLITNAASNWAGSLGRRGLAVAFLTEAALSEQVGRAVRRKLYDWSRSASVTDGLHLTVAQVCGGPLASVYPQIALTRLRHLAVRANDVVREAAIEALGVLVCDRRLRNTVLHEIADWMNGEDPRRSVGFRAFVRLAGLRDDDGGIVLAGHGGHRVLPTLWREVLRAPDTYVEARRTATEWLEAAVQGLADRTLVIEVLAETVRSSRDLAMLTSLIVDWVRSASDDVDRREIGIELLGRTQDQIGAPVMLLEEPS